MIYYSSKKSRLVTRCDCCRMVTIEGYEGETDRLEMTCGILKDAGWMQRKVGGRWMQICPDCKDELIKEIRRRKVEALQDGESE